MTRGASATSWNTCCDAHLAGRARLLRLRAARRHDLDEGLAADLVERQPGRQRLLLGDGAARDAAQEVVEQALAGGRVVEHVADQGRLRGLVDEVAQPLGRRPEAV